MQKIPRSCHFYHVYLAYRQTCYIRTYKKREQFYYAKYIKNWQKFNILTAWYYRGFTVHTVRGVTHISLMRSARQAHFCSPEGNEWSEEARRQRRRTKTHTQYQVPPPPSLKCSFLKKTYKCVWVVRQRRGRGLCYIRRYKACCCVCTLAYSHYSNGAIYGVGFLPCPAAKCVRHHPMYPVRPRGIKMSLPVENV